MHVRAGKRRRAVGSSRQRGLARVVGGVARAHSRLRPASAGGAKDWPEFALRKPEISELDRAVALYDQVRRRLEVIEQQVEMPTRLWRALFDRADDASDTEERDDLRAHAQHLRGTIARLKRQPLQRLYSWVHAASAQSALAGAIAAYGAALALAIAASQAPGQAAWADELNAGARQAVVWYPLDARLFYANAVASGFAVATAAVFYLVVLCASAPRLRA